jgi:hypothetical protein
LHTTDLPPVHEASCLSLKDRIVCEAVNDLEKAVEEVDKLEYEHDNLNKEVGSSFHLYCHCLIFLVVTCSLLELGLKLRDF